ncbi:uncharacterized protein MONOS_12574 [Monocercomonoides exilis]|uniref:uncharacterized protein n=1 Tax=Monocercomonoides exilis TaxID=2049356 RepID=UPI00355A7B95|nr:hypothetical protein MONOS_12574 [Monocercomonoides exilis]|eukprot:MONOS_12574.1-p1 / transcript=MONOS_12574.1 / gene=MONOS_12574 / organism=Monocercomonoides_exilis_PA203 / gene_product=unspecified product / transcript_product=unspecified product / location=Mono_scaffold00704:22569-22922(-) / protein_length=118 / sequence_SO=supercontig / SO=protein_coding / is_pseudo=false
MDAFATRENTKADRWCGPGSTLNEDGLQQSWQRGVILAHPPIPLIVPTIVKSMEEKAHVLLLMPDWRGQIWEPLIRMSRHCEWRWKEQNQVLKEGRWMKRMEASLPPGRMRIVLINL